MPLAELGVKTVAKQAEEDLTKVTLPKKETAIIQSESVVAAAEDLNALSFSTKLSPAEKLQVELKSLATTPDTVIEFATTTETETKQEVKTQSAVTKKFTSSVKLPSLIKDPLGFLAGILKMLEQALLGTLYELNQKPNVADVKINLEEEKISLEEELKLKDPKVASDGQLLNDAQIAWDNSETAAKEQPLPRLPKFEE